MCKSKKTVKRNKFTPPSPIKATPSESVSNSDIVSNQKIVSNQGIACPAMFSKPAILRNSAIMSNPANFSKPAILRDSANISNPATLSNPAIHCNSATKSDPAKFSNSATFSNPSMRGDADDVTMTSSSQSKEIHNTYSTLTASNPLEGSTTAVVAVMRGNPKAGYTRHCSNKHCKQTIVWVLLDSGFNGDLIFVNKDKSMLLPYSKRLFPQLWNTSNGIFLTRRKARVELNFFEYSDSKRYHVESDVVKYNEIKRPQYDLILGTVSMEEFGIILNFQDKMITIDETILPMRDINKLQGKSMLRVLRYNHSIAMEPQSRQDATKRAMQILDANYNEADPQSVVTDNCKPLKVDQQKQLLQLLRKYESLFNGTLGNWKTKPVSFQLKEGVFPYHG
jgi:hypothetical protein